MDASAITYDIDVFVTSLPSDLRALATDITSKAS